MYFADERKNLWCFYFCHLATEVVGPKYRVVTGVSCSAAFAMGEVVLGGLAWLISPWRHVILVAIVPYFLFVSYYWLISDSVRWLLSRKKYAESKQMLLTIAKVNKTQISEKSLEALVNSPQPSTTPNVSLTSSLCYYQFTIYLAITAVFLTFYIFCGMELRYASLIRPWRTVGKYQLNLKPYS